MSLHDAYARTTPHELAFRSREAAQAFADAVDAEAEGRGADPADPHAFVTMAAADRFVRELAAGDPTPEALLRYGMLAFQGYHFARASWPLYLLDVEASRHLVGDAPEGTTEPPAAAGYLQLPQHLFWAEIGDGAPQSVDGVHWTVGSRRELHGMLVTRVRGDAPGVGVIPLPEAPLEESPAWLHADVHGDGSDYRSAMEGAELDGLYAFRTAGEVLKLLARFFAYVSSTPESVGRAESGGSSESEPVRSSLSYVRVVGPA